MWLTETTPIPQLTVTSHATSASLLEGCQNGYIGAAVDVNAEDTNQIRLFVDPDGSGPLDYIALDALRLGVADGGLHTDADNTGTMAAEESSAWRAYAFEETLETGCKAIVINNGDKDDDGIPDLVDKEVANEHLVPIRLTLPPGYDAPGAKVRFDYMDSPWGLVQGSAETGSCIQGPAEQHGLRLYWADDPSLSKDARFVQSYVADEDPSHEYNLSEFDPDGDGVYYAYVEGVRLSKSAGDFDVKVSYSFPGTESWIRFPQDNVAFTVLPATAPDTDYSGLVRLSDGSVLYSETDLASDAFGMPWGVARTFTKQFGLADADSTSPGWQSLISDKSFPQLNGIADVNGNGWQMVPYMIDTTSTVLVVAGGQPRYSDLVGEDTYMARFGSHAQLTKSGSTFTVTEADGTREVFEKGLLRQVLDPAGNTTVLSYEGQGRLSRVTREDGDFVETFGYRYYGLGEPVGVRGRLQSVVWQRSHGDPSPTTLRSVRYTYYRESEQYGNEGDLRTVTTYEGAIDPAHVDKNKIDTTLYRYEEQGSLAGSLTLVLQPDSYQRAKGAGIEPETALEAALVPYADYRVAYYADGRAHEQFIAAAGGDVSGDTSGEFTYEYEAGVDNGVGTNTWLNRTTEYPPGDQAWRTTYANFAGQTVLTVLSVPGEGGWPYYTRYDNQARVVLSANPSAIASYNAYDPCPAELRADEGLVTVYDYYSSDETTGGAAPGHLREVSISNGEQGLAIPQQALTYKSWKPTLTDPAIYLTEAETTYRDEGGDLPTTTFYDYSFLDATQYQPTRITTKLPVIGIDQNGPGTQTTVEESFDKFGRRTKLIDAEGAVITWDYHSDPFSKVVTEALASGVLDVETTTTYDDFGRPTGTATKPKGDGERRTRITYREWEDASWIDTITPDGLTYAVYLSADGESRYTYDREGNELSSFTTLADKSGRIWMESSSDDKYHVYYWYDEAGRLYDKIEYSSTYGEDWSRTAYDGLGRVTDTYLSLKCTSTSVYDDGGVGDGNLTMITQHPSSSPTDDRVTKMHYDWRNRLIAAEQLGVPHPPVTYFVYDNLDQVVEEYGFDGTGWEGNDVSPKDEIPDRPSDDMMLSKTTYDYDDQGRLYRQKVYSVAPQYDEKGDITGTSLESDKYLTTEYWYDGNGNTIKEAATGSPTVKTQFDALGRVKRQFVTDGTEDADRIQSVGGLQHAPTAYERARTVSGDRVIEQTETQYDGYGDAIFVRTAQRLPSDDASLGPLSRANARVTYLANYYDTVGRLVKTVDFGTGYGPDMSIRPETPDLFLRGIHVAFKDGAVASRRLADGDDSWLATENRYDPLTGRLVETIDTRGVKTEYCAFDNEGRPTQKIVAYAGPSGNVVFDAVESRSDRDLKFEYVYDGFGQVVEEKQLLPRDPKTGESTTRTTKYIYGDSNLHEDGYPL